MIEITQGEKILDAAYDCIARDGYAQVTLRQIARKAGVAVSQISYHYQNKEGLLLAVVARTAANYHQYLRDALHSGLTPRQKGERCIQLYQDVLQKNPQMFRVLYDLAGLALWSEPFRLRVREIFQGIQQEIIKEVFTDELMAELGSGHSAHTLASLFFGGMFGIALQVLLEPENEAISGSLSALVVLFK